MDRKDWRKAAISHLKEHGVVDAHHHTLGRSQRKQRNPGLWDWLSESYLLAASIRAAGLPVQEFLSPSLPDSRRIEMLLPCLKLTRTTTYYRIVREGLLAALDFDLDDLGESSWRSLDTRLREVNHREDWFDEILVKRMNQRSGVLDQHVGGTLVDAIGNPEASDWYDYILRVRPARKPGEVDGKTKKRELDGQYSKAAVKIDSLLYGYLDCTRAELRDLFGGDPEAARDLEGYLGYVDGVFKRIRSDARNVALKSAIAGVRSLSFPPGDRAGAERVFKLAPEQLSRDDVVEFENFMMHDICRRAGKHGLPIQFHTGSAFAGFKDDRSCAASLLTSLIAGHPETRFDLMHGSYPYQGECATLAVRFPNVYLNLAWLTMMSDNDARTALRSWLDQVPANKIMWGGDCVFVEETLGTYLVSRDQVIDVLGERVASGHLRRDDALYYLRRIFSDNAFELFAL